MTNSCGRCVATWSGSAMAHCAHCHRTFSRVSTFDQHRRGGECVDPASLGMVSDVRAGGLAVWGNQADADDMERLRTLRRRREEPADG